MTFCRVPLPNRSQSACRPPARACASNVRQQRANNVRPERPRASPTEQTAICDCARSQARIPGVDIPFDEIEENLDRSWSSRLVDVIEATTDENDETATEAVDLLIELGDPAVAQRLMKIALDSTRTDAARSLALDVACDTDLIPEGDGLRKWWNSEDPVLQKVALIFARRTESDYLQSVLDDPLHPFYLQAAEALESDFDDAERQHSLVAALSHYDSEVQEEAASNAIWDEPKEAEPKLIELANGKDANVAVAAIETLGFYYSRASLHALAELVNHDDEDIADAARESVENVAREFAETRDGLDNPSARAEFAAWCAPVAGAIARFEPYIPSQFDCSPDDDEDEDGQPTSRTLPPSPIPRGSELVEALKDTSGSWRERFKWLRGDNWSTQSDGDRDKLTQVFVEHPDAEVRRASLPILAIWNRTDALLSLMRDERYFVRKSAVYYLQMVPVSRSVAAAVWPWFSEDFAGGNAAAEALNTWLKHAQGDQTELLIQLARNDPRVNLRWAATNELGEDKCHLIVDLIAEEPVVNWSQHSLLLDHLVDAGGRPKGLTRLREIDDLGVAQQCAKFDS